MKKNIPVVTLVFGYLFSSTPLLASNSPSYSYIQVSAQSWDILEFKEVRGPGAMISIELGDTLFVTAEALQISKEDSVGSYTIKEEFDVGSIGIGIRSSTVDNTSWFLSLAQEKWTWDTIETYSGSTDIYTRKPERTVLTIGLHSQLSETVELNCSIQRYNLDYKNGDESDPSDTEKGGAIQLGLNYQFIDNIHLILDYSKSESDLEYDRVGLGLRYSF
jgi:hypothetical protein